MSVYKDTKHNTWYCKFRFTDWQGNKNETTKRGFKTKREAKEYEDNFKAEAKLSPQVTVQRLAEEYLDNIKRNFTASTYNNRRMLISKHILPYFNQMKITDVTPLKINKWQAEILSKDFAESTIKLIDRTFSAMFNFAVKFFNLSANPFNKSGHIGEMVRRTDFWSVDEFKKVDQCMPSIHVRCVEQKTLAIRLLFYSGMREGELFALTRSDFNFVNNTISIDKSYNSNVKKLGDPKTKRSFRTVSMPEQIMWEVEDYFIQSYEEVEHPFKISPNSLMNFFSRAAKKAGVKRIVLHGLRHSHITYLISINMPLPNIAKRVGDTVETIMSNYAHPTSDIDNLISEKLNEIVGQSVVKDE